MSLQRLGPVADRIDATTAAIGRTVAWCLLAMVIVQVAVVLMRYVLGLGSIWLQETVIYAHATLFLLASPWTLQRGGHVRVDIFYANTSPRLKALSAASSWRLLSASPSERKRLSLRVRTAWAAEAGMGFPEGSCANE